MARVYTVTFSNINVTAIQDLFEVTAAAGKPLKILACYVGQTSDVGDAQEEIVPIQFIRGYTVSGSGGSTPTPAPVNPSDVAAGFVSETNNTTVANTGTVAILHSEGWNIRGPYAPVLPPEMQIGVAGGQRLVVRLPVAPVDGLTMYGTLYVQEEG